MSALPLLLRPEGGGRLPSAGRFGTSESSSPGSLSLTVDLLRVRPEDGGSEDAEGDGAGSPHSRSGTMSLLLDEDLEDGGLMEDFADGLLRVLLLEDLAREGCLPRGAGPGEEPWSSKSSHLSGRSGIRSSETPSTLIVLLPGGDHLGGGAGGEPGAAAAGGRPCFLTSSSMTFW